jgi:hypothetical protein
MGSAAGQTAGMATTPEHPRRNRVTPLGDIVAVPLRGAWCGNRGNLHDRGTDVVRFHGGALWITCALEYRGRRLEQWAPGRYTLLFFHDEAVAFAAGHRPCALCRRTDYERYRRAWTDVHGGDAPPAAAAMDRTLHAERLFRGTHRRRLHPTEWTNLPAGAFVLVDGEPALVRDDAIVPWTTSGYGAPQRRPTTGTVDAVTPPSTLDVLRAGYAPQIDASAGRDL